jgi:hypothetical protein
MVGPSRSLWPGFPGCSMRQQSNGTTGRFRLLGLASIGPISTRISALRDCFEGLLQRCLGEVRPKGGRTAAHLRGFEPRGPFSSVCREEGRDEESARNGPHPPRYARRPLPASLGEVSKMALRYASRPLSLMALRVLPAQPLPPRLRRALASFAGRGGRVLDLSMPIRLSPMPPTPSFRPTRSRPPFVALPGERLGGLRPGAPRRRCACRGRTTRASGLHSRAGSATLHGTSK